MIKNLAIFCLTITTIMCATLCFSSNKVKEISIYDLMAHNSFENFKNHVNNCQDCTNAGWDRFKMCNQGYFMADEARPHFTTDEMRMWAQGLIIIKAD